MTTLYRIPLLVWVTVFIIGVVATLWLLSLSSVRVTEPGNASVNQLTPLPPVAGQVSRLNTPTNTIPEGSLTQDVETTGGRMRLLGTVRSPNGTPVAGATVAMTRFVGSSSSQITTTTNDRGEFLAENLRGGRWRVLAWKSPDLKRGAGNITFVDDNTTHTADITLVPVSSDLSVTFTQDTPLSILVTASSERVLPNGTTEDISLNVPVTFVWPLGYSGPSDAVTPATVTGTCNPVGLSGGTLVVRTDNAERTVTLASCRPVPTTTTTTIPPPTPEPSTTTTTTTIPAPSTTTTTTTTLPEGD